MEQSFHASDPPVRLGRPDPAHVMPIAERSAEKPAGAPSGLPSLADALPAPLSQAPIEPGAATSPMVLEELTAYYKSTVAVHRVSMIIQPRRITAIIGPSGCGKSTLIRCLNRMHEVIPDARVTGRVLLDGQDIYGKDVDPVRVRRRVGMVFQRPTPFPTMTLFDNVVAGLRLAGGYSKKEYAEIVERCLRQVALWDEVKDRLHKPGAWLSGGQQQRLCMARVLAVEPEIVLMDEPCSALDPISTLKIEELMQELRNRYTIVIVTHNMQQAARVADMTAVLMLSQQRVGELVEYAPTRQVFTAPKDQRTEAYVTGRIG